jgi:transposase
LVIFGLLTFQVLVPRQFAHVSRSVNMGWGFKENRVAVIALHKRGKSDSQIFELLKPLKISGNFVYRAVKRYKELWGVEDRARSGRPGRVRTKAAIKTVREPIRRHPLRKQKSLSRELNISPRSMSRLIMDDLHMRAYRHQWDTFLLPL